MRKFILSVLLFLPTIFSFAGNPLIINIGKNEYKAANKIWSIDQDDKGVVYFGNDKGLLEFDGIAWHLNCIANKAVIRSVAVASHNTIFTGSFEEFGRWDRDPSGHLVYTSLSKNLPKSTLKNADFWKIHITKNKIYFQSFGSIFAYDVKHVKQIPIGYKAVLFMQKVRNKFFIQEMRKNLFVFSGDSLQAIQGSEIFNNSDVRVMLPYGDNKMLVCSSVKGIYLYDGKSFTQWSPSLSSILSKADLNSGLLASNGLYYFGTITDGVYVVNSKGEIVNHISAATAGLKNNTVLSLFEDNLGNIWCGSDHGLAYIQYQHNLSCYIDFAEKLGSIYDAAIWNKKLYLATNQGIYYITQADMSTPNPIAHAHFISDSQGQVWSFKTIGTKLYCCHNKGLKLIRANDTLQNIENISSGLFHINPATINGKNYLLMATYSLPVVSDYNLKPLDIHWPDNPIYIYNATTDYLGNIWLEHPNHGIYRYRLNPDMKTFESHQYYGGNSKDGLPYKMTLFSYKGRMLFLGDNHFYSYDDIQNRIIPNKILNDCFSSIRHLKKIIPIQNDFYWAIAENAIYKFLYNGYQAHIVETFDMASNNLSLINNSENIAILNDSTSLFCLENGFAIYTRNNRDGKPLSTNIEKPYLQSVKVWNNRNENKYLAGNKKQIIPAQDNNIEFSFLIKNAFASNLSVQFQLIGVDTDWQTPVKTNSISYARLSSGKYTFQIRTIDSRGIVSQTVSYPFEIANPWYNTVVAYFAYLIIFLLLFFLVQILLRRKLKQSHIRQLQELEHKRLRETNKSLEVVIENKNAEILTQTSFIIKRNEMIQKISEVLDEFCNTHKSATLFQLSTKIKLLLNSNINTEDDLKLFLLKFEEKHINFFRIMKENYPDLTINDLRLCACLRLNLSSKEIASLMNISVRAVENNRYRVRKKLNMEPSDNLNDFFLKLDI